MQFLNIAWWILYVAVAIFLQSYTIGIDFLLPGIIVALQERKIWQFIFVFLGFILIQEGIGTMPFGNVFLWYLLAIGFFYTWQWFFEVESFIFILFLSVALAVSHYLIVSMLADIQNIYINHRALQDESVYQMVATPLFWHTINCLRRGVRNATQD